MNQYPAPSATVAWLDILAKVIQRGHKSSPRGMEITEILGSQVKVRMSDPIVLMEARRLSYRFMAGEAWWILSGKNDVESISRYCKRIANFSDDGQTFFGAYGPKIVEQKNYIIRKLEEDSDSRQAVISIWRESPPETKDVSCTVSVQWFIRDNMLHCVDTMRSNDIWLGFPYDVFNFSMLSWAILDELRYRDSDRFKDLRLGTLFLNAGSHHLYSSNLEGAKSMLDLATWQSGAYGSPEDIKFGQTAGSVLGIRPVECQLHSVLHDENLEELSPFFQEFSRKLLK